MSTGFLHTGSVQAFEGLFSSYYPMLHRFAWKLMGDSEAAGDVVSDVFTRLWEDRATLGHVKDEKAYLWMMVRNRTLNAIRQRARAVNHTHSTANSFELPSPDDVLFHILEAETIKELMSAIDHLPTACAKVVRLGLEGFSTKDIAAQLGISAAAVSQQKGRALRLLRERLGPQLFSALIILLHH